MKELCGFLRTHDHYLILSHARPDGDTLGSAAGLSLVLRALGKSAFTARNPEITPKYHPFIAPYLAPEDFPYKTVLSVDTASRDLLPEVHRHLTVDYRIDHHPTLEHYALQNYAAPEDAACGETVYRLALALGLEVTAEMAKVLYLAMTTDTACFRYANANAQSHRIAAALIDTGFDRFSLDETVFFSRRRAQVAVEAAALRDMRFYAKGRVAVNIIPLSLLRETGATEDDLDNISALPRDIEGVVVGLTIREEAGGSKISLRTAAPYAANQVCAALGGGGHAAAAGCRIAMSTEEAEAAVLKVLGSLYPDLQI